MDSHRCGDCKKEFESYENFLIHKLLVENYRLMIAPSKRIPDLRLPKFIKEDCSSSDKTQKKVKPPLKTSETPPVSAPDNLCHTEVSDKSETSSASKVTSSENEEAVDQCSKTCDQESDDNVSVCSQPESLRIDESALAKDSSSPLSAAQMEPDEMKQKLAHCKHCDRYYKNKVVLRVHEETVHSSERPYLCVTCRQTFKTKGSLVRHTRSHTGERPFRCSQCARAFLDSASLHRHVHRVHRLRAGKHQVNEVKVFITKLCDSTTESEAS